MYKTENSVYELTSHTLFCTPRLRQTELTDVGLGVRGYGGQGMGYGLRVTGYGLWGI